MPYLGNELATQFQAFVTQTITGDGSTGYTLDRAVANGKELLVYINNVKQEEGSGKSYTASGTTITFSEAVASGDSCYLVYMGSAQQTVTAPAGSIVSSQFSSADLTLTGDVGIGGSPASGETLTVTKTGADATVRVNGVASQEAALKLQGNNTVTNTFKIASEEDDSGLTIQKWNGSSYVTHLKSDANGHITKPLQTCFQAHNTSTETSVSTGTQHTIEFDTERFDQNGDFNNSTDTFTAPVTGKYQFNIQVYLSNIPTDAGYFYIQLITSNDVYTNIADADAFDAIMSYYVLNISCVTDLDANDTAKVIYYQQGGTASVNINGGGGSESNTSFGGFLVC